MSLSVIALDNPLSASAQTGTASTDRAALVALYNATGGANWTHNTNWLSNRPIGEWQGVTTDNDGRVTQLTLGETNLVGSIPAELGNLSNLSGLYLYRNRLSGEIPSELGNLSSLKRMSLDRNQLSGEIPSALGNLSNIERMRLQNNQLSGEIPSALGNLSNLTVLDLWKNHLSGEIPAELGNLSKGIIYLTPQTPLHPRRILLWSQRTLLRLLIRRSLPLRRRTRMRWTLVRSARWIPSLVRLFPLVK